MIREYISLVNTNNTMKKMSATMCIKVWNIVCPLHVSRIINKQEMRPICKKRAENKKSNDLLFHRKNESHNKIQLSTNDEPLEEKGICKVPWNIVWSQTDKSDQSN